MSSHGVDVRDCVGTADSTSLTSLPGSAHRLSPKKATASATAELCLPTNTRWETTTSTWACAHGRTRGGTRNNEFVEMGGLFRETVGTGTIKKGRRTPLPPGTRDEWPGRWETTEGDEEGEKEMSWGTRPPVTGVGGDSAGRCWLRGGNESCYLFSVLLLRSASSLSSSLRFYRSYWLL